MEPESSLPYSQAPDTCPYPEPARSSPYPHIPLPEDPSYYFPHIYVLVYPMAAFPQVSPPKPCTQLSSLPFGLHDPPIWFFSILSPGQYWARTTAHWAPYYAVFPLACYLISVWPTYSPQHPVLKHPGPAFLPQCERQSFTPIQNNRQNYSSVVEALTEFGSSLTIVMDAVRCGPLSQLMFLGERNWQLAVR